MTTTTSPAMTMLARLLFFGWNGLFLCTMGAGFVPMVWWTLMQDSLEGRVPLDFVIFSNIAVLIPVAATALGVKLWRSPWRLMRLFYCVELPLFVVCLYRLFGIHELTLGSSVLFGFIGLGALGQLHTLLRVAPPAGAWRYLDLMLRTTSLMASLYVALLASFFVIPTLFVLFEITGRAMFLILPMALLALSGVVLLLWPVVSVVASARGYWSAVRLVLRSRAHGGLRAAFVTASAAGLVWLAFSSLPAQPQRRVRDALSAEVGQNDAARLKLMSQRELLRAGLVNAYLARYRYVENRSTSEGAVRSAYWHTVGIPLEYAETIQGWWNWWVSPLLYDGDFYEDRAWATTTYGEIFDAPIERAEREALLAAISATFRREDREAGLLDVDRRRVLLVKQEIQVQESEGFADVEIHEVYENQTYDQEEISYHFSLPESAVITGLWLGETEDLERRYRFVVAPRGAAQAVYKAEVQRRVDPALLEQVGPRQYRLRVFPIPPRVYDRRASADAPRMHLWMSYRTLPEGNRWPLPVLGERRNVYFEKSSERTLNGKVWRSAEAWMPEEERRHGSSFESTRLVDLGDNTVMRVRPALVPSVAPTLAGHTLVVIDRSYSMAAHSAAVAQAVSALEAAASGHGTLRYVLGPTHGRPEPEAVTHVDPRELAFFGSSRSKDLVRAMASELKAERFDAVFVLTDEGTYEHESDQQEKRDLGVPAYWVHLGGRLPLAYDDSTMETIQRRGGAAVTSVREALLRIDAGRESSETFVSMADGFIFELSTPDGTEETGPMAALAARQLVSGATRTGRAEGLAGLDRMHAVAKRFEIVTPYSSMLVLVEDRQRKALAAAERADDRFDREVERGLEHGGPNITGTPEPEEWALFFFGLALAYLASKRPSHKWSLAAFPRRPRVRCSR